MKCRHCKTPTQGCFLDLGFSPPSNAYLFEENLKSAEHYYPLRVHVCQKCWLVQTEDYHSGDQLFTDSYAYFSSVSKSWVNHAKNYVDTVVHKYNLDKKSLVMEVGSNDGYLLQFFIAKGIPCLGIEPTKSTAEYARNRGVNTLEMFFLKKTSLNLPKADLLICNNVFAHVPDINDFTMGLKIALKEDGIITLEFPHLLNLIQKNQFDTIYHEHFSYFSLFTTIKILKSCGLKIFDVEELLTHGGSLRIYACHDHSLRNVTQNVDKILYKEEKARLRDMQTYFDFKNKAFQIKNKFLSFLLSAKEEGKKVVGYGAAAKGNTILNFSGIKKDLLPVVYDANQYKQEKYLPGSHIPVRSPNELKKNPVDYVIIFPWNIRNEIIQDLSNLNVLKASYLTFIPELVIT